MTQAVCKLFDTSLSPKPVTKTTSQDNEPGHLATSSHLTPTPRAAGVLQRALPGLFPARGGGRSMSIAFMIHLFSSHCVVIHLELCCVATRRRWRWHSRCPRCGRCGRFSCAMPASRRVRTTHPMPHWSHVVAAVLVESALVCSCLLANLHLCCLAPQPARTHKRCGAFVASERSLNWRVSCLPGRGRDCAVGGAAAVRRADRP